MASQRILIVDDDVDALRLVGLMLERQGYEILVATNGALAIEKAIETQPRLIILDVMMPDIDGYEVASRLRNHPATETIPILMFTAKAAVNDRIAGFQAGADDYLTKPVRPQDLTGRVQALLDRNASPTDGFDEGDIIGFLPTKGGIGSSMLTLNTAIELCRMHPDVSAALVELQAGCGSIALQLGLDEGALHGASRGTDPDGLSRLLDQPLSYLTKQTILNHMVDHESGLKLLMSSPHPRGIGAQMDGRRVRTILRYLNTHFKYILLDLPADLGAPYLEALHLCDLIMMVVEPNRIGLGMAQAMLKALGGLDINSSKIRVVLVHRVPAIGTLSRTMVEQTLQREMIAGIPPVPDLALESIENSRSIVEMQPQSLVTQQIRRVVQTIVRA